jgi:hypothetical protein
MMHRVIDFEPQREKEKEGKVFTHLPLRPSSLCG